MCEPVSGFPFLLRERREASLGSSSPLGGSDLTFSLDLRQIRLTVHTARPSVRVRAADWQHYSGHDAAAVVFQSAQESDEAFEQAMFRKSARLQQRRQAGG